MPLPVVLRLEGFGAEGTLESLQRRGERCLFIHPSIDGSPLTARTTMTERPKRAKGRATTIRVSRDEGAATRTRRIKAVGPRYIAKRFI